MKLYVMSPFKDKLIGYECRYLEDGHVDLSNISENECEDIVLEQGVLSKMKYEDAIKTFVSITSKLRKNGKLVFSEPDHRLVARQIIYDKLSINVVNEMMENNKCFIPSRDILTTISEVEVYALSQKNKGLFYEFTLSR